MDQAERTMLRLRPEYVLFPDLVMSKIMEEIECWWQKGQEDRTREEQQKAEEMGEKPAPKDARRHPMDLRDRTFDMSWVRPTDMQSDKRVIMPVARQDEEEMLLAARRSIWIRMA